jgi:hypothetical protein
MVLGIVGPVRRRPGEDTGGKASGTSEADRGNRRNACTIRCPGSVQYSICSLVPGLPGNDRGWPAMLPGACTGFSRHSPVGCVREAAAG